LLAPYNPLTDFRGLENLSPGFDTHDGKMFLLGTDQLGRCLLSRVIYGSRYCLMMGCFAILLAASIGIPLGLFAGYIKRVDIFVSKATDILMSFPTILIAIIIVAILGPGFVNAIIAVGITNIAPFIRLTRGQVKAEANKEYTMAAESLGMPRNRILFRHIFPNITSPLIVLGSLGLGTAILESAALSFLNLGVSPPTPEWGSMIRSGMETFLSTNPWISVFSGLAIFLNVLGFNLLGDSLRDKWDPKMRSV
jgi:ABC-type dipeptide/oligopeptide/nickel transport system permease subunit